jgi:hypothetical protein
MNVGTFAALPIAAAVLPGCSGVSDTTVSPTDFVVNRAEDAQAVVAAHARHSGHPLWQRSTRPDVLTAPSLPWPRGPPRA